MKRTYTLMFFLFIELVLAALMQFMQGTEYLLVGLFLLNIIVSLVLAFEPYWKIGAWLLLLSVFEANLFVLNAAIFHVYVHYHGYLNILAIMAGFAVVAMAQFIRSREGQRTPVWIDGLDEDDDEPEEETKGKNERKVYVRVGDIVHDEDCTEIENLKEDDFSLIGSITYAKRKYKPCPRCKPF